MTVLVLDGCRPEPLGAYLKALGVLRLVGEQADPGARGHWAGEVFLLTSRLDRDGLVAFLLDDYRPTPLVSPWNGGSGFGPKDRQIGIAAIEQSDLPRLADYREAVRVGRDIRAVAEREGWPKESVVEACRARLPDAAVAWLDATVVLAGDRPGYPPLLGTGGNDGRLEFSNNFMQRLVEILWPTRRGKPDPELARAWLADSLYATGGSERVRASVGQFDPGAAGGANSSPLGAAESLVNPWDWVLLLEGALLFASAAARRLGTESRGTTSMPFTFEASPVGFPSAAEEEGARGEVWVPLWQRPATSHEIAQLMGEARAEWRGRQASSGVDMARAVASLGVDRGVVSFARHTIVERFGRNMLAVPAGRVSVRAEPALPVTGQLDPWLVRLRRIDQKPATVRAGLRLVDVALYGLATRGGALALQAVLEAVAELEIAVGRSTAFRENAQIAPISSLAARDWLTPLDDGTPELRVAMGLASLRDDDGACLRWLVRPVQPQARGRRLEWVDAAPVAGLGVRSLTQVLAGAHARRAVDAVAMAEETEREGPGVQTAFRWGASAPAPDVAAFVEGRLDDTRVAGLFAGLMLLDWGGAPRQSWADEPLPALVPASWAVLTPFFHGRTIRSPDLTTVELQPEASWPAALGAGRVAPVVAAALCRLRMARLAPAVTAPEVVAAASPLGERLAAALLCRLTPTAVASLLGRVVPRPLD